MTDVGKRIKARRVALGISADVLAEKTGLSRATIFRYENGSIDSVNVNKLQPIAKALLTTPAYLMGWEEDNQAEPITEVEKPSNVQKLLDYAKTVPEDKADQILRMMKAFLASEKE